MALQPGRVMAQCGAIAAQDESQRKLGSDRMLLWSYWEMTHPFPSPGFPMNQLFWLLIGESVDSTTAKNAKFFSHWSTFTLSSRSEFAHAASAHWFSL